MPEFQRKMRSEKVVMATQQFQMISQSLHPSGMTQCPAAQEGRTLSDSQIQSFNVGRVQLSGILGVLPSLFPSPRRSESRFVFDFNDAVFSPFLDDLAVKTPNSKDAPYNLLIEFETIRGDQRETLMNHAGRKISKQPERVSIAPSPDDS